MAKTLIDEIREMNGQQCVSEDFDASMRKRIRAIARMTSRNNHIDAAIEGAQALNNKRLEKVFRSIKDIANIEGHMPSDLVSYRASKMDEMFKEANKKWPKELADMFYGAY